MKHQITHAAAFNAPVGRKRGIESNHRLLRSKRTECDRESNTTVNVWLTIDASAENPFPRDGHLELEGVSAILVISHGNLTREGAAGTLQRHLNGVSTTQAKVCKLINRTQSQTNNIASLDIFQAIHA